MHATREEAEEFLAAFRFAIRFGECRFKGHSEVDRALVELGMTRRAALDEITRLTAVNYSSGPGARGRFERKWCEHEEDEGAS